MKVTKSELKSLIKESVKKHIQKEYLHDKLKYINIELNKLNENEEYQETEVAESSESIFDSKPGETVILNFEGVTLKLQRQLDDLFRVADASESKKLKDGDYVKIQGNDTLEHGKEYTFLIYRQTELDYETNPLESWKIVKN